MYISYVQRIYMFRIKIFLPYYTIVFRIELFYFQFSF